jgi:hypothetical protein
MHPATPSAAWWRWWRKPISTVPRALSTVDVATSEAAIGINQRSDVCAVPAEAMMALVLADAALEKFGGDSLAETVRNVRSYWDVSEREPLEESPRLLSRDMPTPRAEQVLRTKRDGQTADPAPGTGHGDHRGIGGAIQSGALPGERVEIAPAERCPFPPLHRSNERDAPGAGPTINPDEVEFGISGTSPPAPDVLGSRQLAAIAGQPQDPVADQRLDGLAPVAGPALMPTPQRDVSATPGDVIHTGTDESPPEAQVLVGQPVPGVSAGLQ